ncbi:hypothetical protein EMPG_16921 [Blastomyces silverae]|uniref:Uncharacterized protein n=1 Tax=Blastomyces silverae TaxID=2060906 RepID=A0A0H1B928_9EURO|nr:hypothetical protein EMPG_16921 [Blastomyces silverae]
MVMGAERISRAPGADTKAQSGNAKIAGMDEDLQLHGMQYNVALMVLFVPYSLFEAPSNIVLMILRPWVSMDICDVVILGNSDAVNFKRLNMTRTHRTYLGFTRWSNWALLQGASLVLQRYAEFKLCQRRLSRWLLMLYELRRNLPPDS